MFDLLEFVYFHSSLLMPVAVDKVYVLATQLLVV